MSNSLNSFGRFMGELGRRRVFRTAALYVIAAVVVIEATEALMVPLALPLSTLSLMAWAAILGFPLAVGLAWTFDVTPRGIVRTPPDSEESRRRRKVSTEVGLRLTLTGVAAAAVGATTWVIMEPFMPAVAGPVPAALVQPRPAGEVLVSPVEVEGEIDPETGGRATLLLLQGLSGSPGLQPVDPRRLPALDDGEAALTEVARELGVARVVVARLEAAAEGLRFSATVEDLGGAVEASATAVGPSDDLGALVARVVERLAAGGDEGAAPSG